MLLPKIQRGYTACSVANGSGKSARLSSSGDAAPPWPETYTPPELVFLGQIWQCTQGNNEVGFEDGGFARAGTPSPS